GVGDGAAVEPRDGTRALVKVLVNGRVHDLEPAASVAALLERLDLGGQYALVERNGEPVERGRYGEVELEEGDRLVVARAVAGGRRVGLAVGESTDAGAGIDASDADYIGVGPVYATPTKQGRPPVGLELVRYAAARARQPWFAIGGIDAGNVREVVAAGAERVAVVRAIADAPDAERAAALLRAALDGR